jgi:hypothetical protein
MYSGKIAVPPGGGGIRSKLQNDILDIEENIELDEEDEDEDVAENNARQENEQNPNYAVRNALIATVFAR